MANEVKIIVKSEDHTDFGAIGRRAHTSLTTSMRQTMDQVHRDTVNRFRQIGNDSGNELHRHMQGRLIRVRDTFLHEGRNIGDGFSRSLRSRLSSAGPDIGASLGQDIGTNATKEAGSAFAKGGPAFIAIITALIAAAAPVAGAALGIGVVLAFGGALAGLGLMAAFHLKSVQKQVVSFGKFFKSFANDIGKPFEDTWLTIFKTIKGVLKDFQPLLKGAFGEFVAPAITQFVKDLGKAFKELKPAIMPMAEAFRTLMKGLGGALPGIFKSLAQALTDIADQINQNPELFSEFLGDIIKIIPWAFKFIAFLMEAYVWLSKFTGLKNPFAIFAASLNPVVLLLFHFRGAIVAAYNAVAKFVGRAWNAVLNAKDHASNIIHNAGEAAKAFARRVYRAVLNAVNRVAEPVYSATAACKNFANRIYRAHLTAFNNVWSAVNSAIAAGKNWAGRVFTASLNVVKNFLGFGNEHGGIIGGLATGGIVRHFDSGGISGSSMAMVGEAGRELVRLPTGSSVIPHGQTEAIMAKQGKQGLQRDVIIEVRGNGDSFTKWLKESIRVKAGTHSNSVQQALGA